jgi:hypothetical protein
VLPSPSWERAEDLLFRVVDILQLRQKQVAQCFLNHWNLLVHT